MGYHGFPCHTSEWLNTVLKNKKIYIYTQNTRCIYGQYYHQSVDDNIEGTDKMHVLANRLIAEVWVQIMNTCSQMIIILSLVVKCVTPIVLVTFISLSDPMHTTENVGQHPLPHHWAPRSAIGINERYTIYWQKTSLTSIDVDAPINWQCPITHIALW